RLGIEVSREYLERADLVLVCGDSPASLSHARDAVQSASSAPLLEVHTKSDLPGAQEHASAPDGATFVSAESGQGLRELSAAIAAHLRASKGALTIDAPLVTRERHRVALEHACNELRAFLGAWEKRSLPAVVAAVHLRDATRHLEELIGTVDVDDVLDRVFSSFCVGK